MENSRKCVRCQGRLFMDRDYDDRKYYFFCIACGHTEPYISVEPNTRDDHSTPDNGRIREIEAIKAF
jgi:hypothetical protein